MSKSLKYFSKTSGIQYHDGPISNVNPLALKFLARPPNELFFSSIVTSYPLSARYVAAEIDENPEPIIIIFLVIFGSDVVIKNRT